MLLRCVQVISRLQLVVLPVCGTGSEVKRSVRVVDTAVTAKCMAV